MSANGVERVASKLVVTLHDLENVELETSVDVRFLGVAVSIRLGRKVGVLDFRLDVWWPAKRKISLHFKRITIKRKESALFSLPKYGKVGTLSAFARSTRYGRSNCEMLYPMMRSGSTSSTKSRHLDKRSSSFLNSMTCDPTICAQVFRVKTFRTKGLDSPVQAKRRLSQRGMDSERGEGTDLDE